jgi:signal peptidase II
MQENPTPATGATDYGLQTADSRSKYLMPMSIVAAVLLLDQVVKFWIKLTFLYHEHRPVFGDWFYLYFIENEGMAFGITWGGTTGKLLLTLFRLVAVGFIFFWLKRLLETNAHKGLVACVALIMAGAFGNIIDSVFYGIIFSQSTPSQLAELFTAGGGYAPLLHGHVVDMFYFPIWEGYLPQWLPIWGGTYFTFFDAIFNVADASISVGIVSILLFQSVFFKHEPKNAQPENDLVDGKSAQDDAVDATQQRDV